MVEQSGIHDRHGRGWRLAAGVLGVTAIGLAIALAVAVVDDDDVLAPTDSGPTTASVGEPATSPPRPATTTPTTATSATPTSLPPTSPVEPGTPVSPTSAPPNDALDTAVWPAAGAPETYTDPGALVRDFAVRVVGMADPDIGPYLPGDMRSGEIEVRAEPGASLVTTVFVRQLDTTARWWVLGAASANIVVDAPRPLATVASPLPLGGSALAFEGTVEVALWEDGTPAPLATTFVTGSGAPPAGPFAGELTFPDPSAPAGFLLLTSASGEDGSAIEFAALRVFFVERDR